MLLNRKIKVQKAQSLSAANHWFIAGLLLDVIRNASPRILCGMLQKGKEGKTFAFFFGRSRICCNAKFSYTLNLGERDRLSHVSG